MNPLLDIVIRARRKWFPEVNFGGLATPWLDPSPIRAEIFGPERLAHHAISLARAQSIADRPKRVLNLTVRLRQNADVLLAAYRYNGAALLAGQQRWFGLFEQVPGVF